MHISQLKQKILIKISTVTFDTLLPMQNQCIYAINVKILHSCGDKITKGIFDVTDVLKAFLVQKVVKMLKKVVGDRPGEYGR